MNVPRCYTHHQAATQVKHHDSATLLHRAKDEVIKEKGRTGNTGSFFAMRFTLTTFRPILRSLRKLDVVNI